MDARHYSGSTTVTTTSSLLSSCFFSPHINCIEVTSSNQNIFTFHTPIQVFLFPKMEKLSQMLASFSVPPSVCPVMWVQLVVFTVYRMLEWSIVFCPAVSVLKKCFELLIIILLLCLLFLFIFGLIWPYVGDRMLKSNYYYLSVF